METVKGTGRPRPPTRPKPSLAANPNTGSSQVRPERPPVPKRPPVGITDTSSGSSQAPSVSKVPPPLPKLPPSGKLPLTPPKPGEVPPGDGIEDKTREVLSLEEDDSETSKKDPASCEWVTPESNDSSGGASASSGMVSPGASGGGVTPEKCDSNDITRDVGGMTSGNVEDRSTPPKRPRPSVKPRPVPTKRKSLEKVMSVDLTMPSNTDVDTIDQNKQIDSGNVMVIKDLGGTTCDNQVEGSKHDSVVVLAGGGELIESSQTEPEHEKNSHAESLLEQPIKPPRPNKVRKSTLTKFDKSPELLRKESPKSTKRIQQTTLSEFTESPEKSPELLRKESPQSTRKSPPRKTSKTSPIVSQKPSKELNVNKTESNKVQEERRKSGVIRPAPPPPLKPKPNKSVDEAAQVKKIAINMSESISKGLQHQLSAKERPKPLPKPKPSMKRNRSLDSGNPQSEEETLSPDEEKKKVTDKKNVVSCEKLLEEPMGRADVVVEKSGVITDVYDNEVKDKVNDQRHVTDDEKNEAVKTSSVKVRVLPVVKPKPRSKSTENILKGITSDQKEPKTRSKTLNDIFQSSQPDENAAETAEDIQEKKTDAEEKEDFGLKKIDDERPEEPQFVAPPPPAYSDEGGEEAPGEIVPAHKSASSADESCAEKEIIDCVKEQVVANEENEDMKEEVKSGTSPKKVPTRKAPPPPIKVKKPQISPGDKQKSGIDLMTPTSPAPMPPMLKPLSRSTSQDKKTEVKITNQEKHLPPLPPSGDKTESLYDAEGYLAPLSVAAAQGDDVYSYADCPEIFPESDIKKKKRSKRASRSKSDAMLSKGTLVAVATTESDVDAQEKKTRRHSSSSGSGNRTSISSIGSHLYEMIRSRSGSGKSDEMNQEKVKQEGRLSQSIFYVGVEDEHQPSVDVPNFVDNHPLEPKIEKIVENDTESKAMVAIEPIEPYGMTDILASEPKEFERQDSKSIDAEIPVAPPRRKRRTKIENANSFDSLTEETESNNANRGDEVNNNDIEATGHVYEAPPEGESSSGSETDSDSDSDDYIYPEAQNPELEARMKLSLLNSQPPPAPPPRVSISSSPPPLPAKDFPKPYTKTPSSSSSASTPPVPHKLFNFSEGADSANSSASTISGDFENEYSEVDEEDKNRASVSTLTGDNEYNELDENNRISHEYSDVDDISRLMGEHPPVQNQLDDEDFYDDTLLNPKSSDSDTESTLKRASTPTELKQIEELLSSSSFMSRASDISSVSDSTVSSVFAAPDGDSSGLPGSESDTSSDRPVSWASSDAGSDYINMSQHSRSELYINYQPNLPDGDTTSSLNHSDSSDTDMEEDVKVATKEQKEEQEKNELSRKATKVEKKRRKAFYIVKEIVSSEKTFVSVLKLLHVHFRTVLYNSSKQVGYPVVPPNVVNQILKYLPQLLNFNEELLRDLKHRQDNWEEKSKVADIFVKKGPFLKLYTSYIREFESMTTALDEARKKYPDFDRLVREFEASPRCANLALKSYMLKPIQRIPQYRLLLQDYLKQLSEDMPDYKDTQTALVIVSEVADHANQSMKYGDNFKKLWEIQHSLIGQFEVIKPGRVLIKEGELMKLSRKEMQPRMFFLLTDVLLYTTPVSTGYRLNNAIPLTGMKVNKPTKEDFQNEFSILSTQRSFTISARTPQEREDWLTVLQAAIEDNLMKRFSFDVRKVSLTPSSSMSTVPIDIESKDFAVGSRAPVWVPDARVSMCMLCTAEFTVAFRRHHCRACGKVVCGFCSDCKAPLRYLKYKPARVCMECFDTLTKAVDEMEDDLDAVSVGAGQGVGVAGSASADDKTSPWSKSSIKARFKGMRLGSFRKTKHKRPAVLQEVHANDENAEMSGYLKVWRQGKWKKRWFVLKGKALYTYKASEDAAAVESTVLLGYEVRTFNTWFEGVEPNLVLELVHRNTQPMIFRTESPMSREKWINAMREATVP